MTSRLGVVILSAKLYNIQICRNNFHDVARHKVMMFNSIIIASELTQLHFKILSVYILRSCVTCAERIRVVFAVIST